MKDGSSTVQSIIPYYAVPAESEEAENLSREYLQRCWHALRRHVGFIATLTILATIPYNTTLAFNAAEAMASDAAKQTWATKLDDPRPSDR